MACTNCSTGKDKTVTPKGCKSNGGCGTESCNKLSVFDWLSNMTYPNGEELFDVAEVRFKNGRKGFYRNVEKLPLSIGDIIATESSPGHDIGIVTLTGELVRVQMKKKKTESNETLLKIYRKATQKDIDIWQDVRKREEPMKVRAREIAIRLNLEMKISDIEFQGDGSKATFYYTANERVDFRQLIKEFAREFSTRIEMKQVGFRQEAARLGGIGSCGRELCCSTWLTDFRSVNTSAARYQQLSLNPQKLAGQCGKLKCCLNYELDTYLDALKGMPDSDTKISTVNGDAYCQKIDIFKGLMWFAYANNSSNWHILKAENVTEIIELNKNGEKGKELETYAIEPEIVEKNFMNSMGQDSVNRFDLPVKKKRPSRKKVTSKAATTTSNTEVNNSSKNTTAKNNSPRNTSTNKNTSINKNGETKENTARNNNTNRNNTTRNNTTRNNTTRNKRPNNRKPTNNNSINKQNGSKE